MRKALHFLTALFAISFASAQTVGSVFTVGDLNYEVTNDSPNEAKVTGFSGAETASVTIPAMAEDTSNSTTYDVVEIGAGAFKASTTLATVMLPSSVTTLGFEAFSNNSTLTTINLDDVEVLANKVFTVCSSLSDVGSMEKVTTIGDYCFNRCTSINDYTFSSALTHIGTGAIYNSSGSGLPNLGPETINIPNSVATMGTLNFGGYGNLKAMQVNWASPADVVISGTLSNFVRWKDRSTVTVYVPTGTASAYAAGGDAWTGFNFVEGTLADYAPVLTVGDGFTVGDYNYTITSQSPNEVEMAGSTNAALVSIDIPSSVDYGTDTYSVVAVGDNAFKSNTTITSVMLPSTVTTLGVSAFQDATNLASINTENVVTLETAALRNVDGVMSLDLSSLVNMGSNGISRMDGLTSIDLPLVEEIGTYAFVYNDNITSMKLGANITTLYNHSFSGLPGLTVLEIAVETPPTLPVQVQSQGTVLSNVALSVPNSTAVTAYSAASGWDAFGSVVITGTLSSDVISSDVLTVSLSNGVLEVSNASNDVSVLVYDFTGKLLVESNASTIDVSNLAGGIYIVKVLNGTEELVKRVVKS